VALHGQKGLITTSGFDTVFERHAQDSMQRTLANGRMTLYAMGSTWLRR